MTANPTGLVFLVSAVAVESFAQLFLKVGSSGGPRILSPRFRAWAEGSAPSASAGGWVAAGVLLYGLEILLYTLALRRLEVSVAFPVGSLCFVGVAILSRLLLGEEVGTVRWTGVCCIVGGAVLIAL
jgi:multidrug transporter EmrE-like cation transporter